MVFECTYNLQTLLVVASHSFVIVALEYTTFVIFLLVNTIVPFHEPRIFHFLLVFKLFPKGYGPTPSKRKNIVLEQKVVKGFELVLHRKGENPFERRSFSLQSEWEFISK
jgi:hypothetical protein